MCVCVCVCVCVVADLYLVKTSIQVTMVFEIKFCSLFVSLRNVVCIVVVVELRKALISSQV